ncbi:hypothetical protein [Microbacterium sp. SLBN-146]|uniref:hypothetical protein n=1 Tax=Microbacterium sp. SLBN-146 TaxID=2768457 RepID=UPI00114D51C1|nr:hypothetical protein [Microbacterium sp. SLBN-146]TQJ30660.1 hypothetical protein FBY39_1116 [Microbacterium sp. SLBN-146]
MQRDTPPTPVSKGMERGILILLMSAAAVIGLALLLPAVRQLVLIANDETSVSLLTFTDLPASGTTDAGATISSATFESSWVVATGLSDAARWLLGLGVLFGALTAAVTIAAVVFFLLLLMWRRPFHRALITATQIAGAALLIGSILSVGLGGLGRMMAADELNPIAGDVFVVGFTFDPTVLLAGIGVLALSIVFSYGVKLQSDTKGLV